MWLALVVGISIGGNIAVGVTALLWISFALVVLGIWRWAFFPCIALTPEAVIVQNRLTKRSVPYSTIVGVKAGFYGLRLLTKDHNDVTAWAVQKSNEAKWAHRQTRADEVAEAIMSRVGTP
jgi:hypothetical protein